MIFASISHFFKHKLVSYVTILACWSPTDQVNFVTKFYEQGLRVTVSCDPSTLDRVENLRFYGVITTSNETRFPFEKLKTEHFSSWYKWLIIGDNLPYALEVTRYDVDMTLLKASEEGILHTKKTKDMDNITDAISDSPSIIKLLDVYVHPHFGISYHPWAEWTQRAGLQIQHEVDRIRRRINLKKYPLRTATPLGHYSVDKYEGSFQDYLQDTKDLVTDSIIRCSYSAAVILSEALNATHILVPTEYWTSEASNNSMLPMLVAGDAEMSGGFLRIGKSRVERLDFLTQHWPFSTGFTYLAERESSGNMFVTPFSPGVWTSCLVAGVVLAVGMRLTAKSHNEKEGAMISVLATWLQQDASAVPAGASGRWCFIVLCVCSMLVHAYYTSAIVSALMSAGRSGPSTLRELGDSRYSIASDDYDYMRYYMFDRDSNREDLEYLKRKKMTSNLYQPAARGVELIAEGNTAYHTEYNALYPLMKSFTDDKLCKLAYIDTIPETMAYLVTTKRSQFTEVMRVASYWIRETGLQRRLVSRYRFKPAPCRSSLLAERVKFGDIAPMYGAVAALAAASVVILAVEIALAKWGRKTRGSAVTGLIDHEL